MANATLDMLYEEMKVMHRELHALKEILVPEEEFGPGEKQEHERVLSEMASGKEKNWREVAKK